MGILSALFGGRQAEQQQDGPGHAGPVAYGEFYGLTDPYLAQFMTDGAISKAGVSVSTEQALRNPTVLRCVTIISQSVGVLPIHLIDKQTRKKATEHSLFSILHRRPNDWQTSYEFRCLMQMRALVYKNAYALIVRSPLRDKRVMRMVPLHPEKVTVRQNDDWTLRYEYQPPSGGKIIYQASEIFHLRNGMSMDGINGLSMVDQARDAIGIAIAAELAISRVFKNGSFVPGTLNSAKKLGKDVMLRLKSQWNEMYSGANNAGGTPVLEDGLEYKLTGTSPKDAQHNETRGRQIEEIARIFGVPRPLLMVDDTSWGTGIEALGQFFVRYGLNPWLEAWQQAIERSLLSAADVELYEVKFNTGALTRGSLKEQGDYFAKARGAGGHGPWMTANEVRAYMDMPDIDGGDSLDNPMMGHNGVPPIEEDVEVETKPKKEAA